MNLIEVTASTILVALILLGSVQATTGMLGNEIVADHHRQAEWYAEELLAEIRSVPFVSTSSYDGLIQSPPTQTGGIALPRLERWSVTVEVSDVDPASPDHLIEPNADELALLRRIKVTMTDPDGRTFSRSNLISRIARSQGVNGSIDSRGRLQWQSSTGPHQMTVSLSNLPER